MIQGPEGDKMIEMALKDPQNYVLKPQREGGGIWIVTHSY